VEQTVHRSRRSRNRRWKRIALWGLVAVLVLGLVAGGAFYLWFRSEVGAANERVDPGIVQALGEGASTSTSTSASMSPSLSPPASVTAGGGLGAAGLTGVSPTSSSTTTTIGKPSGMNIALLGSDTRASSGEGGRSDSMILVHVDPTKNFLSMLSIPRDLRVEIPGHPPNRINAAHTYGGPALLIRTIQSSLGIDLDHYIEVDFQAFKQITDTLGGVYVDIDRTYDDGAIRFDPGYQLLSGKQALGFVRTRHDSNADFGRMERQQRFIAAVREQAMGWSLPLKLPGLIKSLFENIDTDLSANDILKLAYWGVRLDGSRMRMAKLDAAYARLDGVAYLVATPEQLQQAAREFLTEPAPVKETSPEEAAPPTGARLKAAALSGIEVRIVNSTGRAGQGALAAAWALRQGAAVTSVKQAGAATGNPGVTYPPGKADAAKEVAAAVGIAMTRQGAAGKSITVTLTTPWGVAEDQTPTVSAAGGAGAIGNAQQWTTLQSQVGFSLVAPVLVPAGCTYSYQRSYSIQAGGKSVPAVRVGYKYGSEDRYMGVSETTWLDAPIASPGLQVKGLGGIIFTAVGSSTKTDHVWWKEGGVLHWVSNTLGFDLDREQMLTAAMSAIPVQPASAGAAQ
jgi:polyisoprenyl-teichoic acid--peptidoglycan teichoic acid transferase